MKTIENQWLRLFSDCLIHLTGNNVKLKFSADMVYIPEEDIYTYGYWDDDDKNNLVLACKISTKTEEWMPIFFHEYCHFCQYLDKCEIWRRNKNIVSDEVVKIYNNEPISEKLLNNHMSAIRDLELDCEKRVVKLLKRYKIPIEINSYIKRANAYVWFHNHVKTYRSWYPDSNPPYLNKKIFNACSSTFHESYDITPPRVAKAFEEVYPSKKINNVIR